ncbi:hypothetical protein D9613_009860 [Agrocybe pediades]|uniref:NmrA-like domain-containing protein n=1 Tax=Agrocybe pediades TaxID=84607 RepID=A0A8H4QX41_9AGAR|nr:hypothetical protein D9613_009860 [Agrocybe pediades]
MTTLITGGTGRTGGSLARLLHAADRPFLVASRTGKSSNPDFKAVTFDWFDPSTYENAFKDDIVPPVDRVYLLPPGGLMATLTQSGPFIGFAISKGVKRFVLLTSSQTLRGTPALGEIHQYLIDKGVEYTVLKPTWYMQNFNANFLHSIRKDNEVFSASGEGKVPWVSTEDVAQAAFDALTIEKSPNTEWLVLGPELYSIDHAAELLSSILGRKITHKKNTALEQEEMYKGMGAPPDLSHLLADLERLIKEGKEAALVDQPAEGKYVGKRILEQFFLENRDLWIV